MVEHGVRDDVDEEVDDDVARHSVAHGISQDNTMSLAEIKETREKIKILELAFAIWVLKIAIKNT